MGVGFFLAPIFLLLFYVVPIGLFFYKKIRRNIRLILLLIPIFFTVFFIVFAIIESKKTSELYAKFPQVNNITFKNLPLDIKDSIIQLQVILDKLPKRWDHKSVSYTLDKYPDSYNYFNFNWIKIGYFDTLITNSDFRTISIPDFQKSTWEEYINSDFLPFDILNPKEASRFIGLIKYLDFNKLNAANLEDGIISLTYNDSLRISENTGFRTIVIDTSGYYGSDFFDIIDIKDGIYLLRKK
jgi:hypothetical protein